MIMGVVFGLCFFFFSSRRRHTRYIGDWSSDVCSSDLAIRLNQIASVPFGEISSWLKPALSKNAIAWSRAKIGRASLGKECGIGWSQAHEEKKTIRKVGVREYAP